MAGTVTTDLLFFTGATTGSSSCDNLTDWTGTPAPSLDIAQFVQGAGALLSYNAASTTSRTFIFTSVATSVQGKAVYFWFSVGKVSFLNTRDAGGLRITLESTVGNNATWYVAGSDTLPHNGFICHAVDTSVTPDATTGTVNLASITKVTVTATGAFPGKANCWVDAIRTGTKVIIEAGTAGAPATFDDIIEAEKTTANRWGVVEDVGGLCSSKVR